MDTPPTVWPKAPSPTPGILGIAGAPGAWATCPAKTVAVWCAYIATAAMPPAPVYSHRIPPPRSPVRIDPLWETPSAASACAKVGQVGAPAATGAVVADGAVVAEDVGLAV